MNCSRWIPCYAPFLYVMLLLIVFWNICFYVTLVWFVFFVWNLTIVGVYIFKFLFIFLVFLLVNSDQKALSVSSFFCTLFKCHKSWHNVIYFLFFAIIRVRKINLDDVFTYLALTFLRTCFWFFVNVGSYEIAGHLKEKATKTKFYLYIKFTSIKLAFLQ